MKHFFAIACLFLGMWFSLVSGPLPENVKKRLDEHREELKEKLVEWNQRKYATGGLNTAKPEWLPGYIIKYDIARVANADKLRRIVQIYGLKDIRVPQKYIYQVVDQAVAPVTEDNSIVVAELIPGAIGCCCKLNPEQKKQLEIVVKRAQHTDLLDNCDNYIMANDGKVYIVDTDSWAMSCRGNE